MDERLDIYNHKERIEKQLQGLMKSEDILKENKEKIREYIRSCILAGYREPSILKNLFLIQNVAKMISKPFEKCNRKDIEEMVEKIEKNPEWSDRTKVNHKKIIKTFYKWLKKTDGFPEEVKWIKAPIKFRYKLPETLLTKEEIEKMVEKASNIRDKALIYVLYESGCRIGELLNLRMKHVQFDKYGAVLIVNGKTGMRRVRIVKSASYLLKYINAHPEKENPESPLWVLATGRYKKTNRFLSYRAVNKMIAETAKRCGINKDVNPHAFRHARATELASYLTEAQMKEFFGWTQSSGMASVYVHMSGKQVDSRLLEIYGIKKEKKGEVEKVKEVFKECPRCKQQNPVDAKFCEKCWLPLDLQTAQKLSEVERIRDEVMTKPKYEKLFKEFLAWLQKNAEKI
jgi:integrase/ribosomal protein L40E